MTHPNPVSVLLSSLPLDFAPAVRLAAALGFTHVDVIARTERPAEHLEALADAGVHVACTPLGRGLPDGCTLDAPAIEVRREALRLCQQQAADAARLGATHCYVVPGTDASAEGLTRFADACRLLADYAAGRMLRLCIEHVPGRALPTAAATLAWLDGLERPELGLLLDIGHCLISREDPAAVIRQAGGRLGYVHFDDNDGVGDLHWPLLTGQLTQETLQATLAALRDAGYSGALALELNAGNPDPVEALRQGKALLHAAATPVC